MRSVALRLLRSGRQRFTIMLIPHSEEPVRNLQLNTYALLFTGLLVLVVLTGFTYLVAAANGSEHRVEERDLALRSTEASLEQVRQEVGEFLHVYEEFKRALAGTFRSFDVSSPVRVDEPSTGQDLAALLNLSTFAEGDRREMLELQRAVDTLRASMGPLAEISDVLDLHRQLLTDIPNLWPVINGLGYVTMEFGPAIHPFLRTWYMHRGIDIAYFPGTPIVAAGNGVVTDVGFDNVSGFGGYVEMDHPYGFRTKYAHLQAISVRQGQEVTQGQRIGTMGSTGTATGVHLHFEIMVGTELIDPAHFLKLSNPDFVRRVQIRR